MLQLLRSPRLSAVSDRFLLQWGTWGSWSVPSRAEGEYEGLHSHVRDTNAISLSWVVTGRVGSLLLKPHPAWPSLITFPSLPAPPTSL